MSYISHEQRAKIVQAIKDGMEYVDAAKAYHVREKTIRGWLKKKSNNAHTSSTEVEKLKRENLALKEMLADMMLRHKLNKKSPLFGS